MMISKLELLKGDKYKINGNIVINHPTLGEIEQFGEKQYWSIVSTLTASSYDFRFQLDDMGYDYDEIDDYTVFCGFAPTLSIDETGIFFGNLDFQKFTLQADDNGDVLLVNCDGIKIDKIIYELIVDYLRSIHHLKRNYKIAGNQRARHFFLVEERKKLEDKMKQEKNNEQTILGDTISALVNCNDFKYDYSSIWNLKIYSFMDSISRVQKNINYNNLMTGIYTGNIDSSKIPNSQMNWI